MTSMPRTCRSSEQRRRPAGRGCSRGRRPPRSSAPRRPGRVGGRSQAASWPSRPRRTPRRRDSGKDSDDDGEPNDPRVPLGGSGGVALSVLAGREDPDDARAPLASGPPRQPVELHHPDGPATTTSQSGASPTRANAAPAPIASRSPLTNSMSTGCSATRNGLSGLITSPSPTTPRITHQGHVTSGGGSLPWHVSPEPCGSLHVFCGRHRRDRSPLGSPALRADRGCAGAGGLRLFPHLGRGVGSPPAIACSDGYTALLRLLWAASNDPASSYPSRVTRSAPDRFQVGVEVPICTRSRREPAIGCWRR